MKRIFRLPDGANRAPNDVEREIDLHIDLRAREFEAAGMSGDEARKAALEAFGDRRAVTPRVCDVGHTAAPRWFTPACGPACGPMRRRRGIRRGL